MALFSAMRQVTEEYRPDFLVESLTMDSLARRPMTLRHSSVELTLSWSTFGNDTFGKGPYRLRILARPIAENFEAVVFDSLRIESDRAVYTFTDTMTWPLRIARSGAAWTDRYLDPPFDFDYRGGEAVETRFWYRIENSYDTLASFEEIRWVPVRIKQFVPIV
jgi:hypothetical protein